MPEGEKFSAYIERLVNCPSFKRTCSTEELYLESYERYERRLMMGMWVLTCVG